MRFFFAIALLLAALMTLAHPVRSDGGFLTAIDDMPLADGLTEQKSSAMVFDTGQGRISEVTATGTAAIDAVMSFYTVSLPQLGWSAAGKNVWRRSGSKATAVWRRGAEKLLIELKQQNGRLEAGFVLTPIDHKP